MTSGQGGAANAIDGSTIEDGPPSISTPMADASEPVMPASPDAADAGPGPVEALYINPTSDMVTSSPYSVDFSRFYAWAVLADASRRDVSDVAVWSTIPDTIAYVDRPGLVIGLQPGVATVQAAYGGKSATASLTVDGDKVTAFRIEAPVDVLAVGDGEDLVVKAIYGDPNSPSPFFRDITAAVSLDSVPPGVVTVQSGHVQAIAGGTTTVRALLGGTTQATLQLTVPAAALQSITIAPSSVNLTITQKLQLQATGNFLDNTKLDLTQVVSWSSSSADVARFDPGSTLGLLIAGFRGDALISAQWHDVVQSAPVHVDLGNPTSIAFAPDDGTLHVLERRQLPDVYAVYPDGTMSSVSDLVTLTIDDPAVVSILPSLLEAHKPGTTQLHASLVGKLSAVMPLSVDAATITEIQVTPPGLFVPPNTTARVEAYYDDDFQTDVTPDATWSIDDPTLATISIDATGIPHFAALKAGETTVTAKVRTLSATAHLTTYQP
jgi:hypothetical protein